MKIIEHIPDESVLSIEDAPVVTPEMVPESATPPPGSHRIYVAYAWSEKGGKRTGFGAMVMQTHFEDVETEEQIKAVFLKCTELTGKQDLTILNWKPLDG